MTTGIGGDRLILIYVKEHFVIISVDADFYNSSGRSIDSMLRYPAQRHIDCACYIYYLSVMNYN